MAKKLELAEVITALRNELSIAKQAGDGQAIRFNINSVDVELETTVEYDASVEVGSKIKFFVFDADAKGKAGAKQGAKHKIKLSLQVLDNERPDQETGKPGILQVAGDAAADSPEHSKSECEQASHQSVAGDG